jgi:hypothetical protein
MRCFTLRHVPTTDLGNKLCLREVDALDRRKQRVLLGAQLAGGCLERGHHLLDLVHGLQPLIHGIQALEDGCEDIVRLAARTLAGVGAHAGGSEPVPRDTKLSAVAAARTEEPNRRYVLLKWRLNPGPWRRNGVAPEWQRTSQVQS